MQIPMSHVRVARVVGESDDGITLFVPKDENGVFNVEPGEDGKPVQFLTIIFTKAAELGKGRLETWLPWS